MIVNTKVMRTDTPEEEAAAVEEAARLLCKGEVVGIPTETVYGLGANALSPQAVARIFEAKGRPQNNPLIVHIADLAMLEDLVVMQNDLRKRLAETFWPGPLTIIFPKGETIPSCVTAGLDTVAIRMPAHPLARAIIRRAGIPVAAPSANLSGKPSTTTADHVRKDLEGKIPLIVDGGACEVGLESTVVAVKGDAITVLRPGGITPEMICKAFPDALVEVAPEAMRPLREGEQAPSPGMMHKHYSPEAKVLLCHGTSEQIVAFANTYAGKNAVFIGDRQDCHKVAIDTLPYEGEGEEARLIFDDLRLADEKGYDYVIVSQAAGDGIGLAINNRLLRAAGFEVIHL